jgi:hypothetical protein
MSRIHGTVVCAVVDVRSAPVVNTTVEPKLTLNVKVGCAVTTLLTWPEARIHKPFADEPIVCADGVKRLRRQQRRGGGERCEVGAGCLRGGQDFAERE